jgi:hypothetical protein
VLAVAVTGCGSPGAERGQPAGTEAPRVTQTAPEATPEATPRASTETTPAQATAETAPAQATAPAPRAPCTRQEFASPLPLAEASGATYLPDPEAPVLLVVGDSGTRGAFLELDPATGKVLASGRLPLGHGASDDLEGLTLIGETIYGLTSSGWMRHWRRHRKRSGDARYQLVAGPYPVAEPGADDEGLVCASARDVNCGRNYEGLCLRDAPDPAATCAGFAVSKADGKLYCLTLQPDGRVLARAEDPIAVGPPETLTGCDFVPGAAAGAAEDLVWVGSNAFAFNRVFTVAGWQTPASARVSLVGILGSGFGEALAVAPGGAVYRFSDTANARSLADRYDCE